MPPNRKNPTLFASNDELGSLKIPLQTKFLPLTDPEEAEKQLKEQQKCVQRKCVQQRLIPDPRKEKQAPKISYWDWPSDTAEDEKLAAIDDLFSTSRLESNLIADSTRREEDSTLQTPVFDSKNQEEKSKESESYWDWSNEHREYVETEDDSQDINSCTESTGRDREECCDNYWEWPHDEVTEDTCSDISPSHRLQILMAESRKKFVRRHNHLPEPVPGANKTATSEHYWHWSEC